MYVVRRLDAAVARHWRQHWPVTGFIAAITGDDAHAKHGGVLAPLMWGAFYGLTWLVLLSAGTPPAADDPAEQ